MRCTCSSAASVALAFAACTYQPPPQLPRPPLPLQLPAGVGTAVPDLVAEQRTDLGGGSCTGVLTTATDSVRFQLRRCGGAGPRPLVVLLPILAGGDDLLDSVARRMLDHGFDVTWCARAGSALRPPARGPDLDDLFRRTVLHQRILLQWLRRQPDLRPTGWFALGMSMGSMVATVLAAIEPDLDGVAVCLAGGDMADMVLHSTEGRVRRWVDWRRREDGVGDDHLRWELEQYLRHEPLRFAVSVPTAKVLMVSATLDTVVPTRNQDLLWEALGRPARLSVPLGHYTAALAIEPILAAAAAHFRSRRPAGS